MAGLRAILGFTSLALIAGSVVLIFFVVLGGVTDSTPLNKTYWLQADTSTIAGAGRAVSQWTYFYVCGAENKDCGKAVPALPLGYAWVGGSAGAPAALVGKFAKHTTSKYYYYMGRIGWSFYLVGLVFDVLAFFSALLAPWSRLASGLGGFVLAGALFFFTIGASMLTATFVKAHKEFNKSNIQAKYGRYALGFTWGAEAAMIVALILLFFGVAFGGRKDTTATRSAAGPTSSRGFFRRQRSRRSARGSFVDNESQRRVKDEYA